MNTEKEATRLNLIFVLECLGGEIKRTNQEILAVAIAAKIQTSSRFIGDKISEICNAIEGKNPMTLEDLQNRIQGVLEDLSGY